MGRVSKREISEFYESDERSSINVNCKTYEYTVLYSYMDQYTYEYMVRRSRSDLFHNQCLKSTNHVEENSSLKNSSLSLLISFAKIC